MVRDCKKESQNRMDQAKPKILVMPHSELINYGCRNCVWRLHAQCPHDIKEIEVYTFIESAQEIKGYCKEFSDFLNTFAENEDSISAVWEKFAVYVAKLQSMEDYKSYMELEQRIRNLESKKVKDEKVIAILNEKRDRLKDWWGKLNEVVIKSFSKIVDREKKVLEMERRPIGYDDPKKVNFGTPKEIEVKKE